MTEQTTGAPAQPFSARGPVVLGFAGIALLVGGLIGWSLFASVSAAVIATGRVEVQNRAQVVENINGGTVGEILVRDGDIVAKNDVLLRFGDTRLRAEEALLTAQYAELAAQRGRLEAEFRNATVIVWDQELIALAEADPSVQEILDGQTRLFQARASARTGEEAQLREQIGQMREQIAGLEAQAVSVDHQSQLIVRELTAQRALFERGLAALVDVLRLEREETRLAGQAGAIAASVARAHGQIAELEIQLLQIDMRRIEDAEEQARATQARENQVQERLASVRDRIAGLDVRAPVAGEVFGMAVFAEREVVRPDEPILRIVPTDAGLVVIVQVEPIHVDQIHEGQEAILRFSAFPARVTPVFAGRVARISADAIRDAESGLSWYELEITISGPVVAGDMPADATAADELEHGAAVGGRAQADDLVFTPGMPVEVHIRTGERSPLSYLAKPLTDFFLRSMREE